MNSIAKADLNFWEENIYAKTTIEICTFQLQTRLDEMANGISECQLNEESKEVAVSIASYVAKLLSSRSNYNQSKEKLILGEWSQSWQIPKVALSWRFNCAKLSINWFHFPNFHHFILHITPKYTKWQKAKTEKSLKTFYQNIWTKLWITKIGQLDFQCKLVSIFFILMSRK